MSPWISYLKFHIHPLHSYLPYSLIIFSYHLSPSSCHIVYLSIVIMYHLQLGVVLVLPTDVFQASRRCLVQSGQSINICLNEWIYLFGAPKKILYLVWECSWEHHLTTGKMVFTAHSVLGERALPEEYVLWAEQACVFSLSSKLFITGFVLQSMFISL